MGQIRSPLPVKLVVGMLAGQPSFFQRAEVALVTRFGAIDYRSEMLPFEATEYYADELGAEVWRQFIAFKDLIDPGELAEIKAWTNAREEELSVAGRRSVNLDPGYITGAKLVLATTKNHGHRIYIGQGIYAEITLSYRNKEFVPLAWTYPDYATAVYRRIMQDIRAIYMTQLRQLKES